MEGGVKGDGPYTQTFLTRVRVDAWVRRLARLEKCVSVPLVEGNLGHDARDGPRCEAGNRVALKAWNELVCSAPDTRIVTLFVKHNHELLGYDLAVFERLWRREHLRLLHQFTPLFN